MMGVGRASGEGRATAAAQEAISSPLLEETITGATGVILNITGGPGLTLHEVHDAADVIYSAVDPEANILFGSVIDEKLGDDIVITVISTGFNRSRQQAEMIQATTVTPPTVREILEETDVVITSDMVTVSAVVETVETVEPEFTPLASASFVQETPAPAPVKKQETDDLDDFELDVPAFLRNIIH